jgi:hypothetical protein
VTRRAQKTEMSRLFMSTDLLWFPRVMHNYRAISLFLHADFVHDGMNERGKNDCATRNYLVDRTAHRKEA